MISGIEGYGSVIDRFFEASKAIEFAELHACLLPLLPAAGSRVLEVGAGSGRDAAALARMHYDVTAVEPHHAFFARAKDLHAGSAITWVCDSLPDLDRLGGNTEPFDFILCHAVWQHLDPQERPRAMQRVADLLVPGGVFALGLRHGPRGAGTHYFPSSPDETEALASSVRLRVELSLRNQASVLPGKANVTWTRLVFSKH